MQKLQQLIANTEKSCGGIVGMSALLLETNAAISYRGEHPFLLCSTYKIPIAVALLQQVENAKIALSDLIPIQDYDLRPGVNSTINQLEYSAAVKISVMHLLQFMLQESCNTATDIVLRLVGGPLAVQKVLEKSGIENMRIDSFTFDVIAAWDGVLSLPVNHHCTLQQYDEMAANISAETIRLSREHIKTSERDHGSPQAMTQLLRKIVQHEIINKAHADLLFNIMRRCKLGQNRIVSLLPKDSIVSHKTGTLGGYVNDVGIIIPPYSTQQILLSIFVENLSHPEYDNERVIAEVARLVFDYFLLQE